MKLLRATLKDLQDSGQQAAIVGHFSIQFSHYKKVTEINDVHDSPKIAISSTDKNQTPNRYTAEQEQNGMGWVCPVIPPIVLLPDLVEIIDAWSKLPDSMRTGILAMVKTTFRQ